MSAAQTVWLSGRFVDEARAHVPATSPAITLGVGVFETLRVVGGAAPLLDRHIARLHGASHRLGLGRADTDWDAVIRELARRNRLRNGVARITLAPDFALVNTRRLPRDLAAERASGIALRTAEITWPVAELKTTSRLALWLAERDAGDAELLLLGRGGRLLETTRANFFCVTDAGLETAPLRSPVLPGVARGIVLELARELGAPVRQRAPRWRERSAWHGAFATNAVRGVRPVASIDDQRWSAPSSALLIRQLQKGLDREMGLR